MGVSDLDYLIEYLKCERFRCQKPVADRTEQEKRQLLKALMDAR